MSRRDLEPALLTVKECQSALPFSIQ